jgi:hypothetical protein
MGYLEKMKTEQHNSCLVHCISHKCLQWVVHLFQLAVCVLKAKCLSTTPYKGSRTTIPCTLELGIKWGEWSALCICCFSQAWTHTPQYPVRKKKHLCPDRDSNPCCPAQSVTSLTQPLQVISLVQSIFIYWPSFYFLKRVAQINILKWVYFSLYLSTCYSNCKCTKVLKERRMHIFCTVKTSTSREAGNISK